MEVREALAQLAIAKSLNSYKALLGLRRWLLEGAGIESEVFSP